MNKMMTSRRVFLATSVSALALAGCGGGDSGGGPDEPAPVDGGVDPEIVDLSEDDIEIAEMLLSEFEQDPANEQFSSLVAPIERGTTKRDKIGVAQRELARNPEKRWFYWPDDDLRTFDYAHIAGMGAAIAKDDGTEISTDQIDDTFELTVEVLQKLVDANYFQHAIDTALEENESADSRVIVALRGAEIVDDGRGEDATIQIRDRRPDHRNPNCVFVVWNQSEGATDVLRVFEGSTIPSELYLALYQSFDGQMYRSSMMPQGFHLRSLGNMNVGRSVHPNTLRQKSICPVIREPNPDRDYFDVSTSVWDPNSSSGRVSSVGAHIHAAYWDTRERPGWEWKFSSAGCQTICGSVSNDRSSGAIVDFFDAMALPEASAESGEYTSAKYATSYPMVLLSGREARLHAQGAPMSKMRRIRFGSSIDGDANPDHPIVKVQEALGVTADGQFGAGSMLKLIEIQREDSWLIGTVPDGILTPDQAETQDIELT